MNFKEWLIKESQWASFRNPMTINGVTCDTVDFRFEDYARGNPGAPAHPGLQYVRGSFSAPLDNGRWINYTEIGAEDIPEIADYAQYKAMRSRGEIVKPLRAPKGQINITKRPLHHRILPEDWAKYATFYLNNHIMKTPAYPRDDYEKYGRLDLPLAPEKQKIPVHPKIPVEPIFYK